MYAGMCMDMCMDMCTDMCVVILCSNCIMALQQRAVTVECPCGDCTLTG